MVSGMYILSGDIDEIGNAITIYSRLYSPFGLGTSVDFELEWKDECLYPDFYFWTKVATRRPSNCRWYEPNVSAVDTSWVPKRYQGVLFNVVQHEDYSVNIDIAPAKKVALAAETLFGHQNLLNSYQSFYLLVESTLEHSI